MKLPGPIELARLMRRALASREAWESAADRTVVGADPDDRVRVHFHLKDEGVVRIEVVVDGLPPAELVEAIRLAFNDALSRRDDFWTEASEDLAS